MFVNGPRYVLLTLQRYNIPISHLYVSVRSVLFYAVLYDKHHNHVIWTRKRRLLLNTNNIFWTRITRISRIYFQHTNNIFEHESHESHEYIFSTRISRISRILPSALWTRDFFWTRISRITRICASRYCSRWIINPWDLWDPCAKNIRVIREIRVQKSRVQKNIIRVQKK